MICLSKPEVLQIIQLPNLQHLFMLYVATCVQTFVINGPLLKSYSKNTKNTNGPESGYRQSLF